MASLALAASIVFLFVLLIGPFTFLLSLFKSMPKVILGIFSIISMISGIWFVCLPIGPAKYVGLISVFFGFRVFQNHVVTR